MEKIYGIEYTKPEVILLQDTGIGVPELAARTCYDSFDNSENECIKDFNFAMQEDMNGAIREALLPEVNNIKSSELLDDLAWTYFHHSILEHANLSFLVKGTSRGVLQEHARHRIQAISVRSTRYTMSGIINAYTASKYYYDKGLTFFTNKLLKMDMFVTADEDYNRLEISGIFDKLVYQNNILGNDEFNKLAVAKSSLEYLEGEEPLIAEAVFELLQAGKKKRNVGDAFKHIVTDNWKVDMVVTFNLRSLKNYFTLRDSGAAFFQIQWLAKAMKEQTPSKYLDLIVKNKDK